MPYAERERDTVLQDIIGQYGYAGLAHKLGIAKNPRQTIYEWRQVPERWLEKVSKVTRRSFHQLRPDLYARNGRRIG